MAADTYTETWHNFTLAKHKYYTNRNVMQSHEIWSHWHCTNTIQKQIYYRTMKYDHTSIAQILYKYKYYTEPCDIFTLALHCTNMLHIQIHIQPCNMVTLALQCTNTLHIQIHMHVHIYANFIQSHDILSHWHCNLHNTNTNIIQSHGLLSHWHCTKLNLTGSWIWCIVYILVSNEYNPGATFFSCDVICDVLQNSKQKQKVCHQSCSKIASYLKYMRTFSQFSRTPRFSIVVTHFHSIKLFWPMIQWSQ